LIKKKRNFKDAEKHCQSRGGNLAEVRDLNSWNYAKRLLDGKNKVWIGTKADDNKSWTFSDNSEIGFWDFGGNGYCQKDCKPSDNRPVYSS
jgi:hypothetical protein